MQKEYQLLTPPSASAATPAEVYRYLRQQAGGEDDALLAVLIGAAGEYVEMSTGRALITQQWTLQQPNWDANRVRFQLQYATYYGGLSADFWGQYESTGQWPTAKTPIVTLDRTPLVSVDSVKIWPADGSAQITLVPGTDYNVDTESTPGFIIPTPGNVWAPVYLRPDAITVNFTSGYGPAPANVPASLRLAVWAIASHWYDNRAIITETRSVEDVPHTLTDLLTKWRVRGMIA